MRENEIVQIEIPHIKSFNTKYLKFWQKNPFKETPWQGIWIDIDSNGEEQIKKLHNNGIPKYSKNDYNSHFSALKAEISATKANQNPTFPIILQGYWTNPKKTVEFNVTGYKINNLEQNIDPELFKYNTLLKAVNTQSQLNKTTHFKQETDLETKSKLLEQIHTLKNIQHRNELTDKLINDANIHAYTFKALKDQQYEYNKAIIKAYLGKK